MTKIISIDLDDTLLNQKKQITEENKKAISECCKKNIKIVLTTGRPINGIMPIIKELKMENVDTYIISFNGAAIYHNPDKKLIFAKTITGKDIKKIYQYTVGYDCCFHAFRPDQTIIAFGYNKYVDYAKRVNNLTLIQEKIENIEDNEIFVKCIISAEPEILAKINDNITKETKLEYSVFRSAPFFLEFLNNACSKGSALLFLAKELNLKREDLAAIGDNENDLSMINAAGIGIAMDNAIPEVKNCAKYLTKSCEESGVAYAIYNYILKESCQK